MPQAKARLIAKRWIAKALKRSSGSMRSVMSELLAGLNKLVISPERNAEATNAHGVFATLSSIIVAAASKHGMNKVGFLTILERSDAKVYFIFWETGPCWDP